MPEWAATLGALFGCLFVLLALGTPVAIAFLVVSVGGLYVHLGGVTALSLIGGSAFGSLAQFALVPVPLFILMGEILSRSGLAAQTVDAADKWIGRVPGRLSLTAVGAGAIFGTVSGSSMASVAMLGSTLMPQMERQRYKPSMSVAAILGAGGLAVLIPPSALGVLLGALAKVSIGSLLIACVIPGLLLAILYGAYFLGRGWLQPSVAPRWSGAVAGLRDRLRTLVHLVPLAILMMVVTGFIFFGIATPSETAALGVLAAALLALAARSLSWRALRDSLTATAGTTGMILLIIVGSTAYSQLLAVTGATAGLTQAVQSLDLPPLAVVFCMQIALFVLGCFLDAISIMLLTVPVFVPLVIAYGMDPVWFCVLVLIQLELGGITPPFGVLLYVMKGVRPELSMREIWAAAGPIVLLQFVLCALVTLFPALTLWLPSLMTGPR
jgi:tripartite ATP-independent transporter DctM subunit